MAEFKTRRAPKGLRKTDADEVPKEDAEDDEQQEVSAKLGEVRGMQKKAKGKRGVEANMVLKQKEEEEEEEEDQWGLLDTSFAGSSSGRQVDTHLEQYLNERLYKKDAQAEEKKERTREQKLYDVPEELQVKDFTVGAADKMSWVAGLAEVALPVEYKLANIEATEKAKREFLVGDSAGQKTAVFEPDAVTRKAFGSRFMHFTDKTADAKRATDDAVLERFRKRMKQ
mmetsp:Transcript_65436/g.156485  ORF Transcript_65436/g.156485 Transcript_65436/m.156485 type:complete len:227 (-) Transcript_65436:143-823(-)|eukprot:CAMPEP_0178414930 /NCGR_PEP_ID=MMETSP0689_2-20121128/23289_1 /TAXON_ID=160604 /ORGANISM="Amphidinium massartii, Strain CS-259" /LENGTH=226 /DNA_ID=CAMNT_0020036233 /DNA_START=134 /DNA_END=814 /DNA_ORIENTATION=+